MKSLPLHAPTEVPRWARKALESMLDVRTRQNIDFDTLRCVFERSKSNSSVLGFEVRLHEGSGPMQECRFLTLRRAPADRLLEEERRLARHAVHATRWCDPLPACVTDAQHGYSVRCFPADRRLPALAWQLEARALTRLLEADPHSKGWRLRKRRSRIEVLSYRPERRVVAAWTTSEIDDRTELRRQRRFVLRIHDGRLGSRRELYRSLAHADVRAPEWVADGERGEQLETRVAGRALPFDAAPERAELEEIGATIARVHTRVPVRVLDSEHYGYQCLGAAQTAIENLRPHDELRADIARAQLARLESQSPRTRLRAVLHGDLHPGQLLETQSGFALVDWDRATIGDPAMDLGNFIAHLQLHGASAEDVHALRRGYRHVAPIEEQRLEWQRRVQLLRLLDLGHRRPGSVPEDWVDRILAALQSGRLQ